MATNSVKPNQSPAKGNQSVTIGLGNTTNAKANVKSNLKVVNSAQASAGKVGNYVAMPKESNKSKSDSAGNSTSTALQKTAVVTANKYTVNKDSNKSGANKEGTILIHADIDVSVDSSNGNTRENTKISDLKTSDTNKTEIGIQQDANGNVISNILEKDKKIMDKSDGQSAVKGTGSSLAKKKAEKQMQNVLQVVPTKLTENIVRTAPKSVKQENSGTKTVSNKALTKANTNNNKQNMASVNMQLSPSAQVVNRVANQANNDKVSKDLKSEIAENQKNVAKENMTEKTVNKGTNNNVSDKVQGKDNVGSRANSVQPGQNVQTRNMNFNGSKSANSGSQKTLGNVRRTSASYTPRFQTGLTSKQNTSVSIKSDTKTGAESGVSSTAKRDVMTAAQPESKTVKSSSPTELVSSSVSKAASISKSYNMNSSQTIAKPSPVTTVTASNSSPAVKPSVTERPELGVKKHSVLSKSVSDPLEKPGKSANASIVSKSVCQMPSVGSVPGDKTQMSKSLPRSSSMSIIEEKTEKKLMSSSDTKIQSTTDKTKKRPASDGPTLPCEKDNVDKKPTKPLIEIYPDGVPRVSQRNYIDIANPLTTPVIVNPFEELELKREKENMQKLEGRALTASEFGFVVDKPGIERSKTQVSVKGQKSKSSKKGGSLGKPSSAQSRGSSARKKRSRSKDPNKSDTESSRPKSGKSGRRVKSGKRKRKVPVNLAKENEKADVALIGGIGWQIATSCIDKSEADAVFVSQIDSSESESECVEMVDENTPLHLDIPSDMNLHIPNAIETPSSAHSPRFKEVQPAFDATSKEKLPKMENDGYRPMNLDLTQNSIRSQNRSGVIIGQDMPGDISDLLTQLKEDDSEMFADDDEYVEEESYDYDDEGNNLDYVLNRAGVICQLTPIPESPSLSNTLTSAQKVPVTQAVEAALQKFDQNVKEEDLDKLLGATPRGDSGSTTRAKSNAARKGSGSVQGTTSQPGSAPSSGVMSRKGSGTVQATGSQPTSAQSKGQVSRTNSGSVKGSQPGSAQSKGQGSRNNSSVSRNNNFSAGSKERINKSAATKSLTSPKASIGDIKDKHAGVKSGDILRRSISTESLNKSRDYNSVKLSSRGEDTKFNSLKENQNSETKERIDSKITDLKKLLADKMNTTQKLLQESSQRRKGAVDQVSKMNELKINVQELTEENIKALDSSNMDDEVKSTRSSRRERKFSETKKDSKDEELNEAIDEILSNTYPSMKSTLKSNSIRSANSTLTEMDKNVLKQMVQEKKASPFHAQVPGSVKGSSSFDDSITLNKDNPDLMKRFHADNFKLGQKVKAMVDAGAEPSKIRAMIEADNENNLTKPAKAAGIKSESEAKQIAKIMNSFRQMELYAGSNNKSSKKETPRREGEHMFTSMSRFDHGAPHVSHSGMPPRPGSAGAGRHKPGKFTEIKGKSATLDKRDRAHSPVHVPKVCAHVLSMKYCFALFYNDIIYISYIL